LASNDWQKLKLKDLAPKITKGTTPSKKDGGFSDAGINFIKAESVDYDGVIDENTFAFINEDIHNKFKRSQLAEEDILFSMAGAYLGKTGFVEQKYLPANTNQALAIIRTDKNKVLPKFIHYCLRQRKIVHFVNNSISQSAQPNINLQQIGDLDIDLPPLSEQINIVSVLSALDRKITLNRQTNQTLEKMAQALFKSWFVDFDPVIDNALATGTNISDFPEPLQKRAELRKTVQQSVGAKKLPEDIRKLFPNEFEESELGWVSKGWEVSTIKAFGRVVTGKTPPKKIDDAFDNIGIPFITPTDVGEDAYALNTARYLSDIGKQTVKNNVINAGSVCVTCIGSQMGKTIIAPVESVSNQQLNSVVLFDQRDRDYLFINLRLRRDELFNLGSSGSTMPILNKTSFENLQVLKPTDSILKTFESMTKEMLEQILLLSKQSGELSKLRDFLLPKLISGDITLNKDVA